MQKSPRTAASYRFRVVFFLALGLGGLPVAERAHAENRVMPPVEVYTGARSAGFSGAGVALADDETTVFVNPAGIGKEDSSKNFVRAAAFPNVTVGWDGYSLAMAQAYLKAGSDRAEQAEKVILAARDRTVSWGRVSLFPYLTMGRFQLGVLADVVAESSLTRLETPEASTFSSPENPLTYDAKIAAWARSQTALVAGFSMPYRDTGMAFGFATRLAWRTSLQRDIEVSDEVVRKSADSVLHDLNKTKGMAIDAGFLYEPRVAMSPSLGLAVHDLGDTLYRGKGANVNEVEKMNVVAGASLKLLSGADMPLTFITTLEGHHLTDSRFEGKDRWRLGGEIYFSDRSSLSPFSFRFGHNLRGFSFGASVEALFARLEYGSDLEMVHSSGESRFDRRNYIRLSVDLRS